MLRPAEQDARPPSAPPRRQRTAIELLIVAILFSLAGLWYAGPSFVKHMNTGISHMPVDGAVVRMAPGDPYDAYYRHLLPYYNLQRGHAPFYTGYQYNLGQAAPFREGMMYVPFALTASLLAFATGPILAFNLLAILSFALCGMFAYLLGREVTGSRIGGVLAATVMALAPFRIGFLFSQMFYGTDMALLPLALFAFLRFLKRTDWKYALLFGTSILLLSTANIALFYWFTVLFMPLFVWGAFHTFRTLHGQWRRLAGIAVAAGVPLLLSALFLLYVKSVMAASGLGAGQGIGEVRNFSPAFHDMFERWTGIETTIYLGLAGAAALIGALSLLFRRPPESMNRIFAVYTAGVFFVAYALSLGITLDDATGVRLYEFVFQYLPFANGSRTPGRVVPLAIVSAAVLVPLGWGWLSARMRSDSGRAALGLVLAAAIAADFKFSSVTMTTLAGPNRAYAAIEPERGTAIGLPLQQEAEHYLHATFQYYAVVNDVRMVNGHSSMFPPDWDKLMLKVRTLNEGVATRSVIDELATRGVHYIVAHSTGFEPRVSPMAVAVLSHNPALRKVAEDDGITVFEIVAPARAPESVDGGEFARAVLETADLPGGDALQKSGVMQLTGWYAREAYPGQTPFRWMEGKVGLLMVVAQPGKQATEVAFEYRCPLGDLVIEGRDIQVERGRGRTEGWKAARIEVRGGKGPEVVSLSTPALFTAPGDPRQFGCMIGDIEAR